MDQEMNKFMSGLGVYFGGGCIINFNVDLEECLRWVGVGCSWWSGEIKSPISGGLSDPSVSHLLDSWIEHVIYPLLLKIIIFFLWRKLPEKSLIYQVKWTLCDAIYICNIQKISRHERTVIYPRPNEFLRY